MESNTENGKEIRAARSSKYKGIVRLLWILTILGIIGVIVLFWMLSNSNLPSFEELENPKYDQASQVLAVDGTTLGRYYVENRIPVAYEELSPNLVNALIATEDERFYGHAGIDAEALGRAITKTFLLSNSSAGGASTITQQLAKLLFTDKPASGFKRVIQKLKEWVIAVRLERKYTKEEIISMYLNKFNFINGAYGIRAASEIYFNKKPSELGQEEAAMLVGMLKNPSLYNPMRFPEKTMKRREVVLKQMQKNELITQVDYDSLRVIPLDMTRFERKTHADGPAPYFRMELRERLKKILADPQTERKADGSTYDIYRDGLKIQTTIDPIIQNHLEEAAMEHMKELQKTFIKRWGKDDPWTHKTVEEGEVITTDEQLEIRQKSLEKLIYTSKRAQRLRAGFLNKIIAEIKEDIDGFELRDRDIERMLSEEKESGYLLKLERSKMIGSKLRKKYNTVMRGDKWSSLKSQWRKYHNEVERTFDQKVKMKVFTYENEQLEKDTVMTPLDSVRYHRMFLQVGSMAVDPVTGHVKAWVGGINHKYFQYDHVTSDRQVGSTFKPIIYATAISQQGFSPCFEVEDIPYTIHVGEGNFHLQRDWTPKNAGNEFSGEIFSLFKGLQWSKNTVSVYLMKQLGDAAPVLELAKNMGFAKGKIPPTPSICLGAADLSVFEMTGAYTTFANEGLYNQPIFIQSIQDKYGHEIYRGIREDHPALHPNHAYVMMEMLNRVMTQGIRGFQGIKSQMGGKTGTTNDYTDGWFMGLTPGLVVGTWVGGEDRWIRFRSLSYGTGGKMARPIFQKLIRRLENDPKADYDVNARFKIPPGDIGIELDCEMYRMERGGGSTAGGWGDEENNSEGFGEDDQFGDEIDTPLDSLGQPIPINQQTGDEDEEFGEDFD